MTGIKVNDDNFQSRAEWIDFARGIAIASVIVGHYIFNLLGVLIFAFHIPLFCVISGILAKPNNLKISIRKVVSKTMPYYCYTAVIICLISILIMHVNPIFDWLLGMNNSTTYFNVVYGIGPMWYLLAYIIASIISSQLIRINDSTKSFLLSCVLCLIGVMISRMLILPYQIDNGLVLTVFICFGYCVKQKDLLNLKISWGISLLMLVVGLGVSYLIGCQSYASRVYPLFPTTIILSMLMCFVILKLCKDFYSDNYITNYFRWIGRNSMKILAIHTVEYTFLLPIINSVSIVGERHIDSVIHSGFSLLINSLALFIVLYLSRMRKSND